MKKPIHSIPGPTQPATTDQIIWQGRPLGTKTTLLRYEGRCDVRPLGRGITLRDLVHEPHLEDILGEGSYEVESRVVRRLVPHEKEPT